MKQATNLKSISLALGLPDYPTKNSPEDYNLIRQLQIVEFDGEKWMPFAATGWELAVRSTLVGTNQTGEYASPEFYIGSRTCCEPGRLSCRSFAPFTGKHLETPPLKEAASYDLPDHPTVVSPR